MRNWAHAEKEKKKCIAISSMLLKSKGKKLIVVAKAKHN